jgi:hypothetical protein
MRFTVDFGTAAIIVDAGAGILIALARITGTQYGKIVLNRLLGPT